MKRGTGSAFARAFVLGMLYESGQTITTARIRKEFGVAKATAKRDMKVIRSLVPVTPHRSFTGQLPQRALKPNRQITVDGIQKSVADARMVSA